MRLIDADEVLKYKYTPDDCLYEVVEVDDILEAPTVDAAPEVHGRWVKGTSCGTYWNYCSICGGKILKNEYQQDYFSDYCPFCGARMDGGEGE